MVKVVYCCTSEKTTFELREANIFFPLIMITDFVAQFSGDAQYPLIRYAQSQVEKGVHKITFPGLRMEQYAQIDWQGCFTLLAVPDNVFSILLLTLAAVA